MRALAFCCVSFKYTTYTLLQRNKWKGCSVWWWLVVLHFIANAPTQANKYGKNVYTNVWTGYVPSSRARFSKESQPQENMLRWCVDVWSTDYLLTMLCWNMATAPNIMYFVYNISYKGCGRNSSNVKRTQISILLLYRMHFIAIEMGTMN